MTLYTRYRAAQQVALGEIIIDLLDNVAPLDAPSAVGTEALQRLEVGHNFTLTALPVDDHQLGDDIAAIAAECEAQQGRIADLELDNEGLSRHVAHMERYRMDAARLRAAGRRLLDALPTVWQGSDEAVRLRALVDGQPAPDADPVDFGPFDPETFRRFASTGDGQALADLIEQATGAKAISVESGPATPGPTREQVAAIVVRHFARIGRFDGLAEDVAEDVLALFGRSAPEPPETQP